jgi:uncharacterized protein YmfQ (DUF2313 family)
VGLTATDYARQLKQLLPRGRLWRLDSDSWLSKLMLGIAEELARVDVRGEDLQREWSPATATDAECLADWERVLGLPDPYLLFPPETEAGRQEAAAARYIARGGSSRQYMIDLAASLGFDGVTIEDGVTPHVWTMQVDLTDYSGEAIDQDFEAGYSEAGDDLGGLYVEALERVIWRANPAHTQVYFDYSP